MKLEITKRELMNLISQTQNIVEKRNTMPILVNVLLEAEKDLLKVYATDLEVSLTDSCVCRVQTPGKVAVNARSLCEIIKELGEGSLQLIRKDNNWLEIRQGKYVSKIVGMSADEYPVFPTHANAAFTTIEADVLREMIDKTIFSVSTDETRYYLNGVYFEQKGDQGCTMVATDGHRLCLIRKQVNAPKSLPTGQGVIIPRKGLHEMKKLLEGAEGDFKLAIEGAQLVVVRGSTTLLVRLVEGKYPNYQQFIPQKLGQKVMINREAFLTGLRRVALLANHKSKAVTLAISDGKMEISSNNPELGDAKEEIEVTYAGKDIRVGFNAKYITDILSSIQDENIDFELNDQLSPGLMRPHNDPNYTCVVMPMRI